MGPGPGVLGSWETGPACALAGCSLVGLGDCCSCFSGGSHPIDVDVPSMALSCSLSEMGAWFPRGAQPTFYYSLWGLSDALVP